MTAFKSAQLAAAYTIGCHKPQIIMLVAYYHILDIRRRIQKPGKPQARLNVAAAHLLKKLADRVSMMAGTVTLPAQ